jgi:single-strand DNA-binding protein
MVNEAYFSVAGYVATQPKRGFTKDGARSLYMRVGWTPRRLDTSTGEWVDAPSSFVSVQCFRKMAENAAACLRRGDPIVLKGSLRVREYTDEAGVKRIAVDVLADFIGHDLSRGVSVFSKVTGQLEQTALEHEQAQRQQAGHNPLPGDRQVPVSGDRPDLESADRPDQDPGLQSDLETLDEDERFDEDEATGILAEAAEAGEPAAAPA